MKRAGAKRSSQAKAPKKSRSGGRRVAARELVLERDQRVMKVMSGEDPQKAYDLAADVDDYLDKLAALL